MVVDELRLANWQRTKDGQTGANRPKRLSPLAASERVGKIGKTDLTPDEAKKVLARIGPTPKQGNGADGGQ